MRVYKDQESTLYQCVLELKFDLLIKNDTLTIEAFLSLLFVDLVKIEL